MRLPATARSLKSPKFILFRGLLFVQTTHQGMSEATTIAEVFYYVNYVNVNYSVKNSTVDCKYLLYFL